jgi:hypothetical protein
MVPPAGIPFNVTLQLQDPSVAYILEKAFAEVRAADQPARDLMSIEIEAKRLALTIVAKEGQPLQGEPPGPPADIGEPGVE